MLFHYIYFGRPSDALLHRLIKTVSLYETKAGMLWVLDEEMQIIAEKLLAKMSIASDTKISIKSAIFILQTFATEQIQSPATEFMPHMFQTDPLGPQTAAYEHISRLYFASTQMIFSYLSVLSQKHTMLTQIGPVTREFVTGKELFSLWLAYTYGGVILDAGCEATDNWNLKHLNPNVFYVPSAPGKVVRYEFIKFPKNLHVGVLDDFELILSEVIALILRNTSQQFHQNIQTDFYERVIEIDNWLIISPKYCLVGLYALRMYLLYLPFVYKELYRNKNDNVCAETGEGMFAHFLSAISMSVIVQGYYENSKKHPEDFANCVVKEGYFSGVSEFIGLSHTTLGAVQPQPFQKYLPNERIIKTISSSIKQDGKITAGWRAPLSLEERQAVLDRYQIFSSVWAGCLGLLLNS